MPDAVIYSTTKMVDTFGPPTVVKMRVTQAVDQDLSAILITAYNESGEQFYVKEFVWKQYSGYDMLDTAQISFTGLTKVVQNA